MFTVVVDRPGSTALELTPVAGSVRFATAAVGGFGDASFAVEGDRRRLLTYLATVRIMYGTALVWEGRIEDPKLTISKDSAQTSVTCFGLQRLLSDNGVRRIWSKRDHDWHEMPGGVGTTDGGLTKGSITVSTGAFDPTDASKKGVKATGNGVALAAAAGNVAETLIPLASIQRVMADVTVSGANTGPGKLTGILLIRQTSTWGTAVRDTTGTLDSGPWTNGSVVRLGAYDPVGGLVPTATDIITFTNIRLLGTSLTEDAAGGFYGGTILRDLIPLVPGLTIGVIENGSDFTIEAIERGARSAALDIVKEIAGYYAREWAVWENGRFDWDTPNLDEPQWIVAVADCDLLEIETSVDTLTKTAYVLYTDAASGLPAEASAAATSQRNPFVKTGAAKDVLTDAGFPMTANTSSQFASRIAAVRGGYPPVTGRIVLPATRLIANAVGSRQPAALIRAGSNVLIPGLPKTDVFSQGRDGETLFHIASTEVNMDDGTITLELEGQGREIDVITARLASATRVLTG